MLAYTIAHAGHEARAFVHEFEVRHGVEAGIAPRLLHAVDVADLAREVEDHFARADFSAKAAAFAMSSWMTRTSAAAARLRGLAPQPGTDESTTVTCAPVRRQP